MDFSNATAWQIVASGKDCPLAVGGGTCLGPLVDAAYGQRSKLVIRIVLFNQGLLQQLSHLYQAQWLVIGAGSAVTGNFVMLNFLGTANNSGIHHRRTHIHSHYFLAVVD